MLIYPIQCLYTLRRVVLRYNWNTDNADGANFHSFFQELGTEFQKKSVRIRPIRVIRVPIVPKNTRRKVYTSPKPFVP
jgi:hypothetical protein